MKYVNVLVLRNVHNLPKINPDFRGVAVSLCFTTVIMCHTYSVR